MRRAGVVALCALVVAAFGGVARADTPGSLSGTVTDVATGLPISGVCVDTYYARTTTDLLGRWRIGNLFAGSYHVRFADCDTTDYLPSDYPTNEAPQSVTLANGENRSGIDEKLARGGVLQISLKETSGAPAAGVQYELLDMPGPSQPGGPVHDRTDYATDSTGTVRINKVEDVDVHILFLPPATSDDARQYYPSVYDQLQASFVHVSQGSTTSISDTLAAGVISGTLRDEAGRPVASERVQAFSGGGPDGTNNTTQTASDGTYRIGQLPPAATYKVVTGNGPLEVRCPYDVSYNGNAEAPETAPALDVERGTQLTGVDLTAFHYPTLTVHVQDPAGAPVAGASVALHSGDVSPYPCDGGNQGANVTDANGNLVRRVIHGHIGLDITSTDFAEQLTGVHVGLGQDTSHTVTLTRGGHFGGTVVDPAGNPLAGIRVVGIGYASGTNVYFDTATDGAGHWSSSRLPPGTWTLQFQDQQSSRPGGLFPQRFYGSFDVNQGVPVAEGEDKQLNQTMYHGAVLRLTLRDLSGRLQGNTPVQLYDAAGRLHFQGSTSAGGGLVLGPLDVGRYTMHFGSNGFTAAEWYANAADQAHARVITLTDGVTTDVAAAVGYAHPPTITTNATPAFSLGAVGLSYSGGSSTSAVHHYDVRYRRAGYNGSFGSLQYPSSWQGTTATRISTGAAPGYTYCFSARSRDDAGATSAWSAERCTATALDDRSLSASSGWTRATGSAYFHQTATTTTRTGASLYRSGAAVRRIAVVATTCATCGTVGVYLGSTLLERISLRSSSTANQRVLGALTLSALRTGTITVRALDAHKVVVDGVAVSAR